MNKKLRKIEQKSFEIFDKEGEKAAMDYYKKALKEIENELTLADISEAMIEFEKEVEEAEKRVKKFIEKQKKKNKKKK